MMLYRVISEEEWEQTKKTNKVPRCKSDEREDCVHLTKYEDVTLVANKYFVRSEKPVVLEIDTSELKDKIVWVDPTDEKPWHQPNARVENIDLTSVNRYAYLIAREETENEFELGSFFSNNKEAGNT